jgi:uncharacterized protein
VNKKDRKKKINIEQKHLNKVLEILSQAPKAKFYAFGSRVNGTNKKYSDLDICSQGKLERKSVLKLKDDFYESDLPFKVDFLAKDDLLKIYGKVELVEISNNP